MGYASGNMLAFGFIGYSMSAYDNQFDEAKSMSGLNYGAGVDFLIGDNMFVGAEYIVRDLNGEGNTVQPGQTREAQIQAVQLRVGWNF